MTKLLKYVVPFDFGFAPNPYHGICTLAACTPNHQNARLNPEDWILGHSGVSTNNKIIYLMKVDEIIQRNDYFNREDFQCKKPNLKSKRLLDRYGDNIYYLDNGEWYQINTVFHNEKTEPGHLSKDTRNNKVFTGKEFYYFNNEGFELAKLGFESLIYKGRNYKYEYEEAKIKSLVKFLRKHFDSGIISNSNSQANKLQNKC